MRGQALRAPLLGDRVQVVAPQKTRSQQRLYRKQDVELLLNIRHLLYEERFTIEGARARLRELGHDEGPAPVPPPAESTSASRRYENQARPRGSDTYLRGRRQRTDVSCHRGVAQPG